MAENRVPELSLRRRRVLLVAACSSPCGAARWNAQVTYSGQSERLILVAEHDYYAYWASRTERASLASRSSIPRVHAGLWYRPVEFEYHLDLNALRFWRCSPRSEEHTSEL